MKGFAAIRQRSGSPEKAGSPPKPGSSSVGALADLAKAEKSSEKRLAVALKHLRANINQARSEVLASVEGAVRPQELERSFEHLSLTLAEATNAFATAEADAARDKLKSQAALQEARLETMRKAAAVELRNKENEMQARLDAMMRDGGNAYAVELANKVQILTIEITTRIQEHEACQEELVATTTALEQVAQEKEAVQEQKRETEERLVQTTAEVAEAKAVNTALREEVQAVTEAGAENQAAVEEAQAAVTALKEERGAMQQELQTARKQAGEATQLSTELQHLRENVAQEVASAVHAKEQQIAMLTASLSRASADKKAAEDALKERDRELQEQRELNAALTAELEASRAEARSLGELARDSKEALDAALSKVDQLSSRCRTLEARNSMLADERDTAQREVERMRGGEAWEEVKRLEDVLAQAVEELNRVAGRAEDLRGLALSSLRSLSNHLSFTLGGLRNGTSALQVTSIGRMRNSSSLPAIEPAASKPKPRWVSSTTPLGRSRAASPRPQTSSRKSAPPPVDELEEEHDRRRGGLLHAETLDTARSYAEAVTQAAMMNLTQVAMLGLRGSLGPVRDGAFAEALQEPKGKVPLVAPLGSDGVRAGPGMASRPHTRGTSSHRKAR